MKSEEGICCFYTDVMIHVFINLLGVLNSVGVDKLTNLCFISPLVEIHIPICWVKLGHTLYTE